MNHDVFDILFDGKDFSLIEEMIVAFDFNDSERRMIDRIGAGDNAGALLNQFIKRFILAFFQVLEIGDVENGIIIDGGYIGKCFG